MSEPLPLLTVLETIEAAAAIRGRIETARDARRAITAASTSAIASMAVPLDQLDAIAILAAVTLPTPDHAAFTMTAPEIARVNNLRERLTAAGYLPRPETTAQEPTHGEG